MSTTRQTDRWIAAGGHYEYRVVTLSPDTPHSQAHRLLTDEAEQGRWEMARSVRYWGGGRKVWLRRKVLRVEPTIWL